MSLTYTSALCADGKWYKNPVWRGVSATGEKFFLCLDDDEPPELVVEQYPDAKHILGAKLLAKSILDQLGIKAEINDSSFLKSGRTFIDPRPPEAGRGPPISKTRKAFRFFLFINERPPPPTHFDKLWDGQPPDGVMYFFNTPPLLVPDPPKVAVPDNRVLTADEAEYESRFPKPGTQGRPDLVPKSSLQPKRKP